METNITIDMGFEAKVKAIIANKLNIDEKIIQPESNFINQLDADSLDMVDLVMELENVFNISIPYGQAEKINTVKEVMECVRQNINQHELIIAS
jgi:acyl carrier protein